jgi:sulfate permease, SulP family
MPFHRILVALAGRDTDCALVAYAAMVNRILPQARVHCVHVADQADAQVRAQIGDAVRRGLPGATFEILAGDLLDSVLDAAAAYGADVILLGHGGHRRRRMLARRLAMKAPCSIWMAPDGSRAGIGRILAPVDYSIRSADTLDAATALAEAAGQDECDALHVYFNNATVSFDEFEEVMVEDAAEAFSLFVAPINLHGVHARPALVESARVAPAILRFAAEAGTGLIVMGTRGRSASAAVLLGSETEQVLIGTQVPILAVKHFGARLRLLRALRDERVRLREERFN